MSNKQSELLRTDVLPKFNCSNCKHYITKKQILDTKSEIGFYAVECSNVVHPLEDCIMRGFAAHSEQPGFDQTLNKPIQVVSDNIKISEDITIDFATWLQDNYSQILNRNPKDVRVTPKGKMRKDFTDEIFDISEILKTYKEKFIK